MPKAKSSKKIKSNRMTAGIHLVEITKIDYAKNYKGEILETKSGGDNGIEIWFKNQEGHEISKIFWLSPKAMWVLENLCKAIGITYIPYNEETGEGTDINEVMNSKLFIVVCNIYETFNGERRKNKDGSERIMDSEIVPRFFKLVKEDYRPSIEGDPALNEGIPYGIFAKEVQVTEEFTEEEEKFEETPAPVQEQPDDTLPF